MLVGYDVGAEKRWMNDPNPINNLAELICNEFQSRPAGLFKHIDVEKAFAKLRSDTEAQFGKANHCVCKVDVGAIIPLMFGTQNMFPPTSPVLTVM